MAADPHDEAGCDHDHTAKPTPWAGAPDAVVERAAAIFRAMGDPARLRILEQLAQGERCVTEIADASGDSMSTVSQRLKLLRAERLVDRRREGKHLYYALTDTHVTELIQSALAHAGEGG